MLNCFVELLNIFVIELFNSIFLYCIAVSVFGACGFTASKDGDLIKFELKQESG